MTYSPRVGDRVRAVRTVEGEVTATYDGLAPYVAVKLDSTRFIWELHDEDGWEFEKLAPPEPVWVNGDLVLRPEGAIVLINSEWRYVGTGYLSDGPLPIPQSAILFKRDAA